MTLFHFVRLFVQSFNCLADTKEKSGQSFLTIVNSVAAVQKTEVEEPFGL